MNTSIDKPKNFRDVAFLRQHISSTLAFYHPRCIDPQGGFFHYFRDDGEVFNRRDRHLVSSARFVFNYAMAYRHFGKSEYRDAALHGLKFLNTAHRQQDSGGYAWLLRDGHPMDATNHCYGLAFVLLAHAKALEAGIDAANPGLNHAWELLDKHFWSEADGLYSDEIQSDWTHKSSYRGQNANMHTCEALLAAFAATGDEKFLSRAKTLAYNVTVQLANQANGLIWEHYDTNWIIDWNYNRNNPKHLFRPWGFQPGHQTEWAKLLLLLERHCCEAWMPERAAALFDEAVARSWDNNNGGLFYGFNPEGETCDNDKYFWVQAETFAAAAMLAQRTGDDKYWHWYERIWNYAWAHMIDHNHGAWYRILNSENSKYDDQKSPAGKTDYHTMGACYDVIELLEHRQ